MPPKPASQPDRAQDLEAAWLAKLDATISSQARRHRPDPSSVHQPLLLPPPHPSTLPIDELLRQCTKRRGRSGGPGGQNRNKVETLVEFTHNPTSIAAHAGERRTVLENHRIAVSRLRLALAILVRVIVPAGDCRPQLWRTRCPTAGKQQGRIVVSTAHEDYPAMLAIAMDVLWASELDPKLAALRLCCTPTQLVKLLKDHPHALPFLNAHRSARGEHVLK